MSNERLNESQRRQVERQIDRKLDSGDLVKIDDHRLSDVPIFEETLPEIPAYHLDKLTWNGLWYIKSRPELFSEDGNLHLGSWIISDYLATTMQENDNPEADVIEVDGPQGKLIYNWIPSSSLDSTTINEYQHLNAVFSSNFTAASSGRLPLSVTASLGMKVAIYFNGTLLVEEVSIGQIITTVIPLQKGTVNSVTIYLYDRREVQIGEDSYNRYVEFRTPLANYASSQVFTKPDPPQNPAILAKEEGNLITWSTSTSTAFNVLGTAVFSKREDENVYKRIGFTYQGTNEYLHNADLFNHSINGDFWYTPDILVIPNASVSYQNKPWGTQFASGYLDTTALYPTTGNYDNFSYAADGGGNRDYDFEWRIGAQYLWTDECYDSMFIYPIRQEEDENILPYSLGTGTFDLPIGASTPLTAMGVDSLQDLLNAVPQCPDATAIFGIYRNAAVLDDFQATRASASLALDSVPITGRSNYVLKIHSNLIFSGTFANGESNSWSGTEELSNPTPPCYYRLHYSKGTNIIAEKTSWASLGTLSPGQDGLASNLNWATNEFTILAEDMTTLIVDSGETEEFVIQNIDVLMNINTPIVDKETITPVNGDPDYVQQYYRFWLIGGVSLLPSMPLFLEHGVDYSYKLSHFSKSMIYSNFTDELIATANTLPRPPLEISYENYFSVNAPLTITCASSSVLLAPPTLRISHTGSSNIYGIPYQSPQSAVIPPASYNASNGFASTSWVLDAQTMLDAGFVPFSWLDITDPYPHIFTESDELLIDLEAITDTEETLEASFSVVYDNEPPELNVTADPLFVRLSPSATTYVTASGTEIPLSPGDSATQNYISVRLNKDITPSMLRDWRESGAKVRFMLLKYKGIDVHTPFSLIDEADYEHTTVPTQGVSIYDWYRTNYPTDSFNDDFYYTPEYIQENYVLNSDWATWQEIDVDKEYIVQFTVDPDPNIIGAYLHIQVEDSRGITHESRFEPLEAYFLNQSFNTAYYKDFINLKNEFIYELSDEAVRLRRTSDSSLGRVSKWDPVLSDKIQYVDSFTYDVANNHDDTYPPAFKRVRGEWYVTAFEQMLPFSMCYIGSIPDSIDLTEVPYLEKAFLINDPKFAGGLSDVADVTKLFDSFARFDTTTGGFLRYLLDRQYNPLGGTSESAHDQQAQALTKYSIYHLNPGEVMDVQDFWDNYLYFGLSPNPLDPDGTNTNFSHTAHPKTSFVIHDSVSNSVNSLFKYNADEVDENIFQPPVGCISNLYLVNLNYPFPYERTVTGELITGATPELPNVWNSGPVTAIIYPLFDWTGGGYAINRAVESDYALPDLFDEPASYYDLLPETFYIGGVFDTKYKAYPTCEHISIAPIHTTSLNSDPGGVTQSGRSRYPGFTLSYMTKFMTDGEAREVYSGSACLYSLRYDEGFEINDTIDSTSGTYSFGPTYKKNNRIGITSRGETLVLAEDKAKTYSYSEEVHPVTGGLGNPNYYWGGDDYNLPPRHYMSQIKTITLDHPYKLHVTGFVKSEAEDTLSYTRYYDSTTTSRVVHLNLYLPVNESGDPDPEGGRLTLIYTREIPAVGNIDNIYFDLLPDPDGLGYKVIIGNSPSLAGNEHYHNYGSDANNFDPMIWGVTVGGAHPNYGMYPSAGGTLDLNLDDKVTRDSYGLHSIHSPSMCWLDSTTMGLAMCLEYGEYTGNTFNHGSHFRDPNSNHISETRVGLFAIDINNNTFTNVVTGEDLLEFQVITQPSEPVGWSLTPTYTGSTTNWMLGDSTYGGIYAGFSRIVSPQIWSDRIIENGNVTVPATRTFVAYVQNEQDSNIRGTDYIHHVSDTPFHYYVGDAKEKWVSGNNRLVNSYGPVKVATRTWKAGGTAEELFDIVGVTGYGLGIHANSISIGTDNWGNAALAYTTKPGTEDNFEFPAGVYYPNVRVLKVSNVIPGALGIRGDRPLAG